MADLDATGIRETEEYAIARAQLADREWRLDNLYWIRNKDGQPEKFRRRYAQRHYGEREWFRDVILKSRKLGFCHDPNMRVLTADLRWVRIDDLRVGDKVVSVDEHTPGGKGHHRRMRRAVVQGKRDVYAEAFRLKMSNGETLIATATHRYLGKRREGYPETAWRSVESLRIGDSIRYVTKPWGESNYEDGWMAGFMDGEGHMAGRNLSAGITISQTDNDALDRAAAYLERNGYEYRVEVDNRATYAGGKRGERRKRLYKLCIGRMNEIYRLVGQCRPSRFIGRDWWEGRELPGKKSGEAWAQVVSIEKLPVQRMVDIQTSTKTFICEGFVSHNSTFIAIEILDECLFVGNITAEIIDYTLDDAKAKLEMLRFAYEKLPRSIREGCHLVKDNEAEMVWANGSSCSAGVTSRGGTPQLLHVSEIGRTAQMKPEVAKEIRVGSITAVPQSGKIWVESTGHGTSGEFFDMVKRAEKLKLAGSRLTPVDFKLHFYGWYLDPDNRVQASFVIVPDHLTVYFRELEEKHGIRTDADQRAWYAKEYERLGPDDIKSEHPSVPEEAFYASLEGAYYKAEMSLARRSGRVGHEIPYDPTRPVDTFWDIGMDDENFVGFRQTDGVRNRVIDAVRWSGSGISGGVKLLREKHEQRGFVYGKHYGPHDLEVHDWSQFTAQSRKEVAASFGINFIVVPRVVDKADAIEAGRRLINSTWFCAKHAGALVDALDNYTKAWNKSTSSWMDKPQKNGADHGADSWQQLAMGAQPDAVPGRGNVRPRERRGSQWAR